MSFTPSDDRPRQPRARRIPWTGLRSVLVASIGGIASAAHAQSDHTLIGGYHLLLVGLGALLGVPGMLALLAWQHGQKRDQRRLREEQARNQRLLGLVEACLWRCDADHRVSKLRLPTQAGLEGLPSTAIGHPLWSLFDAASSTLLQDKMRGHGAIHDIELVLAVNDAAPTSRWRLRALPCFDDRGHFDGYEGTAAPVGCPAADGEAAAVAALDAESFSYTVSHDLRAPIRVVEGFTKILKEDYGRLLDRIGNDHLDRVLGAAARMNLMIDALLALSRLSAQPVTRQTVSLTQLAAYVIEDLRRQHPDRRVDVAIQPELQAVGDPTLLRVMLENLLGNAWKYSGQRPLAKIEFGRVSHEGRSAFCIADNGAGFDMRFADRLFGVFQRLHSANDFAGTGIGLASVRRIVQRHGGEIWAEAEPDRGARFYFTLR